MTDGAHDAGPATLMELLEHWLPRQRWFAGKGRGGGGLTPVGELVLPPAITGGAPGTDHVGVRVHLVAAAGAVYQVPLTYRRSPEPALSQALLGVLDGLWVYDGPHDHAFVRGWLRIIAGGLAVDGPTLSIRGVVQASGRRDPAIAPDAPSSVLRGEQSNTSIIVGAQDADPLIVKLFRVVAAGDNPDVVVQSALAAAGCLRVPRPAGWVEATWPDPAAGIGGVPAGTLATGQLAFACEFLTGSEDAWRVALRAVGAGTSFAAAARELGAATAQVHELLAAALPRRRVTPDVLAEMADSALRRVDWAVAHAPVLAPFAERARATADAVRHLVLAPDLQRIHGDFHLGQVLHSPTRGWVLFDFEGEPLRPLYQRMEPDLALRDVAGMLRSFDYAARHATIGLAPDDPRLSRADAWADEAREAFLAGYAAGGGRDAHSDDALLRALELDKALYEVVYELRNRPSWLPIPLAAVRRLLTR